MRSFGAMEGACWQRLGDGEEGLDDELTCGFDEKESNCRSFDSLRSLWMTALFWSGYSD
jgi:hypothetical protein